MITKHSTVRKSKLPSITEKHANDYEWLNDSDNFGDVDKLDLRYFVFNHYFEFDSDTAFDKTRQFSQLFVWNVFWMNLIHI